MKIQSTLILLTGLFLTTSLLGQGLERKPSPEDAKVYFIWPKDGREVNKNFIVKFGLSGMGIAPAGIDFPNSGHHHLLIDVDEMPDFNMPLPATENIVHFGLGADRNQGQPSLGQAHPAVGFRGFSPPAPPTRRGFGEDYHHGEIGKEATPVGS